MLHVLTITAPIYLLIVVGYLAVRGGLMQKSDTRVLGRFVFMFGMPALLFNALTQRHADAEIEWIYMAVYGLGSGLTMLGMIIYALKVRGASVPLAAVQGMSSAASNTAFIGFPILSELLGPTAGMALAMCFIIENLFVMPFGLAYADSAGGSGKLGQALWRSLKSMASNPLLWGLSLGLLFRICGWHLPAVPDKAIQMVSVVASPLALFVVGGSLVGLRLGNQVRDVVTVAGAKLLLHPLLVGGLVLLLPALDPRLGIAAVVNAAMPMAVIVTVMAQRHQQEEFSAAALLVATLSSFVTINLLLMVVTPLLPAAGQ